MRAKEYAEEFRDNPSLETMAEIANAFLRETSELTKGRKCQSREAIFAVLDEQDRKWQSLARLIPGIKPEGYLIVLEQVMPTILYEDYKYYSKQRVR